MKEGRTKNSIQNVIYGFGYQMVMLILSFISRTVFIQTLGEEYLGLNGIFSDVLGLLCMADLGFGTAMAYSFYKPLAENDERKITALIQFYKKIYYMIALFVATIGLLCIPFLDLIVNTKEEIPHLVLYYLFALANVVISYLFVYKTTLMTADQKDYILVKIRTWTSVLKVLLQIIVLLIWHNYILYLCIGLFFQIVYNWVATKRTENLYPYICTKEKVLETGLEKEMKNNIFENMKSVFIYKLSTTLFSATDNILISMIVSTAMVGLYSNYLMLSNKLLLIEQIVFSAMTASIGNVIAKEKAEKRHEVFETMQTISFIFCGIITSGFCLLANDVIRVWLGSKYMLPTITLIAITLNNYLSCVLQPLWSYRDASGLYVKTKYVMFIAACINLFLSVVLGRVIGITGIIFASAIARLCTYFWYEPKLLFKEYFGAPVKKYYFSMGLHFALTTFVICVLAIPLSQFPVASWRGLLIKILLTGICCVGIYCLFYRKSNGFQVIRFKIQNLWRK